MERKIEEYQLSDTLRASISEDLHRGILRELRTAIYTVVQGKRRIAILVDNLDLAWDKREEMLALSEVILGLLDAARSVADDLRRESMSGHPLVVSLAIFLRADIFSNLLSQASEPDKINSYHMSWNDRELLGRVIDERLVHSQGGTIKVEEVWKRFFVANVRGIPTREYFRNIVLPRPRDLLYFVKAAITTAINRGHSSVHEDDVLEAEKRYSQFAVEVLYVESGNSLSRLDDIILSFVGKKTELCTSELFRCFESASVPERSWLSVVETLSALGFLGLEVRPGSFAFVEDISDRRRLIALAKRVVEESGAEQRFSIHPAFWSYLDSPRDAEGTQMRFPWGDVR